MLHSVLQSRGYTKNLGVVRYMTWNDAKKGGYTRCKIEATDGLGICSKMTDDEGGGAEEGGV